MMKLVIGLLLVAIHCVAYGQTVIDGNVIRGQGFDNQNYAPNPFAEKNLLGWTTAGTNATWARDTAAGYKLNGISSFKVTFSGASANASMISNAMPIPDGVTGNCGYKASYTGTDAGNWRVALMANDGTTELVKVQLANTSSGAWADTQEIQYPCATNLKLKAYNSASTSAQFNVGNFRWSKATNIGTATLTQDFQPYTATLSNSGNATSSLQYARIGDSIYIKGRITIGSSLPTGGIIFSLPPGLTIDTTKAGAQGMFGTATGSTGAPFFPIGTLSGQTSTTIGILTVGANSLWNATNPTTWANGQYMEINSGPIPVVGTSSQTVARPEQAAASFGSIKWSAGVINVANNGAAMAAVNNAYFASGNATVSGNGLLSATANDFGIKMPGLPSGTYEVVAKPAAFRAVNNTAVCAWEINDGTTSSGGLRLEYGVNNSAGQLTATFTYTSTADKTFTVRAYRISGTGDCWTTVGDSGSNGAAEISVKPVAQRNPAPLLVGGVTSNSSGLIRTEMASVNSSGTVTAGSHWLSFSSNPSTGKYVMAITSGVFSSMLGCSCSAVSGAATFGGRGCEILDSPTTSSVAVGTGASGSPTAYGFSLKCEGIR